MIRLYIFLLLLLPLPTIASADDRPPPPPGFSWYAAKNGAGTFLKPDGWHVLEKTKGNTDAVIISRENLKKDGKFLVGFTVNRVSSYSSGSSIKASHYAKMFIQKIMDRHEVISSGVVKHGTADMNVARIKRNDTGVAMMTHHITVGMDDRDELFLLSFEAPASEWQTYYETAGQMFSYFVLGS